MALKHRYHGPCAILGSEDLHRILPEYGHKLVVHLVLEAELSRVMFCTLFHNDALQLDSLGQTKPKSQHIP